MHETICKLKLFGFYNFWNGITWLIIYFEKEIDIIKNFLSLCKIENILTEIKEKTIELRKSYNIKLPDAIIASTAIINSVPLLSADTIFSKITELNFIKLQP